MLGFVNAILGGVLLIAGRKLFWLFVAAAGFVTGIQLATRFTNGSEGTAIIIGLVVGVVFAVLAVLVQTIAIGITGFLAGGYAVSVVAGLLGLEGGPLVWITYIAGGIIGVVLVSFLFDWAIITLSALAGASLIVEAVLPSRGPGGLIFFILVIIGVAIQGSTLRAERRHTQHATEN